MSLKVWRKNRSIWAGSRTRESKKSHSRYVLIILNRMPYPLTLAKKPTIESISSNLFPISKITERGKLYGKIDFHDVLNLYIPKIRARISNSHKYKYLNCSLARAFSEKEKLSFICVKILFFIFLAFVSCRQAAHT